VFLDDDFASDSDGNHSFDDGPSSSVKRKLQTTVAGATVGKEQDRSSDKRQHKPTERYGINDAIKDKQVMYATQNRTLKENRRLLLEACKKSSFKRAILSRVNDLLILESNIDSQSFRRVCQRNDPVVLTVTKNINASI